MIIAERPDINQVLHDLSVEMQRRTREGEEIFSPFNVPDSIFLELMEQHDVPPTELPLVKKALEEMFDLYASVGGDRDKALAIATRDTKQ